MWKQKTGISVSNSYGVPVPELVRLVGRTGFDAVSPEWEENDDFAETAEAARDLQSNRCTDPLTLRQRCGRLIQTTRRRL